MPPRAVRKTNATVLFAVEGETEFAFLSNVKQDFVARNVNVSIKLRNAYGHGPLGIVDALMSGSKGKDYDYFAALFDSDIPICAESLAYFTANNVTIFQSSPAIEGTLLRLGNVKLKKNITTAECKKLFAKHYPGDSTDMRFYERHFNHALIQSRRQQIKVMDDIIKYMLSPS
ncbi:hypothetical protein [Pseudomonas syringae]|uniref:hypothetical protein n=1 Tax=Pseudomonas syringae TaxID=317 RepID=UPI000E31B7D4|nr:hypothetical protein [Pseudomonas syringae]